MTNPQLVRIPTLGKDKAPPSKAQKEFNQLAQKIEDLETELVQFRKAATTIQQRLRTEYEPLLREYNQQRAILVRVFDRAHDRPDATKSERKKLVELILDAVYSLISEHGMDELKPVFDKYDAEGYDATDAESERQVLEARKNLASSLYGIQFDEDEDIRTQKKFMTDVQDQMQAKEADQNQVKKPKSAKQIAREGKKQLEERNITKAVRTLYVDLVKAFHPDREPDEPEKIRKTEIVQRVTKAYEATDLLALFRLQFEFDRIDQQHLETLAKDQLRYYNKILQQQVDELSSELYALQSQLSVMTNKSFISISSVVALESSFNNNLREIKKVTKAIKKDVKNLVDPAYMKAFLKTR